MTRICIITHTHLSRNPRVLKEAKALAEAGYEVHVLNSIYSEQLAKNDLRLLNTESIRITHISDLSKKDLRSLIDRVIKKAGGLLVKYLKFETCYALGYAPNRYLKISKSLKADLYICHQELPLYIGTKLINAGYNVAFDIEDWHSEDLPEKRRISRPVALLRYAERFALTKGMYCTTTSMALAQQLSKTYNTKQPTVIYNSFSPIERLFGKVKKAGFPLKLVWFSLNIGPGRGLEEFLLIVNKLNIMVEIHLVGEVEEEYKNTLLLSTSDKCLLTFHPLVDADKLCDLLSEFDIGLAIELHQPKNREFTITNKFFQYIQCGLPVIATNTIGQMEIFKKFTPGLLVDFENISDHEIKSLLTAKDILERFQEQVVLAATAYSWENEVVKLLNLVQSAID
ncbi:glycosyltransferase [Pedobacter aquatilis]|uniref:glycosyltransferase n=1 Tax=Pedobacter aquatilis TaxID=351343 RepID=UPI00292DE3C2|nr:hypothetical protein [Pedobacter aquatilis]